MGKWDFLRDKYSKVPVDGTYREKIDAVLNSPAPRRFFDKDLWQGLPVPPVRDLTNEQLKNLYLKRRAFQDKLNAILKAVNVEVEAMTQLFVERMEDDGESSKTFKDGVSIGVSVEPYAFVRDQAALLEWVKKEGMEAMLTLNYQTMASLVKERLEGKVNAPLPNGVDVYMKDKLSCRGRGK